MFKILRLIALLLLIVFILASSALHNSKLATRYIVPFITRQLDIPVQVSHFNLDWFSELTVDGLKISDLDGLDVTSKHFYVDLELHKLFLKVISVKDIDLVKAAISYDASKAPKSEPTLRTDPEPGKNNFGIDLQSIKIDSSSFKYSDASGEKVSVQDIAIDGTVKSDQESETPSYHIALKKARVETLAYSGSGAKNASLKKLNLSGKSTIANDSWSLSVDGELDDLQIEEAAGADVKLKTLEANFAIEDFKKQVFLIRNLKLVEPDVSYSTKENSKTTVEKENKKESEEGFAFDLDIKKALIQNGSFALKSENAKDDIALTGIQLDARSKLVKKRGLNELLGNLTIEQIASSNIKKPFGVSSEFDVFASDTQYDIRAFTAKALSSGAEAVDLSLTGNLVKDLSSKLSSLKLDVSQLDINELMLVLGIDTSLPEAEKVALEDAAPPEPSAEQVPTASSEEPLIELSPTLEGLWLSLNSDVRNISYKELEIQSLTSSFTVEKKKFELSNLILQSKESLLKADAFANLNLNPIEFGAKSSSDLINLNDIDSQLPKGKVKDFSLNLSGKGFSEKALKDSLDFEIKTILENVDFDKRLEFVIPFNLIFVPFRALQKINQLNPAGALPSIVMGPLNDILGSLNNLQKLACTKATLDVTKQGEFVELKEATFKMAGVLPDLRIPGKIAVVNGSIDINSALGLFEGWLPLPMTGTMSLPYPDIPVFVKELVLTVFNMPGKIVGGVIDAPAALFESVTGEEPPKEVIELEKEVPESAKTKEDTEPLNSEAEPEKSDVQSQNSRQQNEQNSEQNKDELEKMLGTIGQDLQ